MSAGADDTRDYFESGSGDASHYPRRLRRAIARKEWERAAWFEARHSERWIARLDAAARGGCSCPR